MDRQHLTALQRIPRLREYRDQLSLLNRFWDSVSTIGAINQDILHGQGGPLLESMKEMRDEFTTLQGRLLSSLVAETIEKSRGDMFFSAQNTIDILIRNLFERTADVGFLATDTEVRTFLSGSTNTAVSIQKRLASYVEKYSVYDEIVLLDTQGVIKAHLNPLNTDLRVDTEFLHKLRTNDGYLECFGASNLFPSGHSVHYFAHKVQDGKGAVGYLVMFFRLEDELQRIFTRMLHGKEGEVLLLLDNEYRILHSSDEKLFSLGSEVDCTDGSLIKPLNYEDRQYLSRTVKTSGYQDYVGLPWQVRVMVPMSNVVKEESHCRLELIVDSILSPELQKINLESTNINRKLSIVTLNGKSLAARLEARTFMPVLEKIQEVGNEITRVISKSITTLNQTAISTLLSNCRLYSSLAIDIMDRNLYERANDCRWWALTAVFRESLLQSSQTQNPSSHLSDVLSHINHLYTVYSNIFVFNRQGEIIASSKPLAEGMEIGAVLPDKRLLQSTLLLDHHQKYVVSEFEPTTLYHGHATYIYAAAIRSTQGSVLGGVGLVFDSEPEFKAMLSASLPCDDQGEVMDGAGALFVDRHGKVISTTDSHYPVGSRLKLTHEVLSLESGKSYEGVVNINDVPMLLGATASSGYREYKTTGDYQNDVIAIVYMGSRKSGGANKQS